MNTKDFKRKLTAVFSADVAGYRSNGFMTLNMIYAGRPDEGIPFAERMRRADPACLW